MLLGSSGSRSQAEEWDAIATAFDGPLQKGTGLQSALLKALYMNAPTEARSRIQAAFARVINDPAGGMQWTTNVVNLLFSGLPPEKAEAAILRSIREFPGLVEPTISSLSVAPRFLKHDLPYSQLAEQLKSMRQSEDAASQIAKRYRMF